MNKQQSDNQTNGFVSKLLANKCKWAFILSVMFLFSVTTSYASPNQNFVRIMDGDYEVSGYYDEETVEDLIDEHGLIVSRYDVLYPSPDTELESGMIVIIDRLKRVNVTCDGSTVSYWTPADDFKDFFEMHDIEISEEDISDIDFEKELDFDNDISITRVRTQTEEVSEEIPFETRYVDDDTLEKGKTIVKTEGKNGVKITEYKIVTHNGETVSKDVVSEWIDEEPVDKVVARGTKVSKASSSGGTAVPASAPASSPSSAPAQIGSNTITVNGQVYTYTNVLTCSATAYDLSFESTGKRPGDRGYGITASGTYAKPGTVAVDPRVIPLGTKMYIETTDGSIVYGLCTAEDTGGAIKGNKVDLFYNTNAECMNFGRRSVKVYILK